CNFTNNNATTGGAIYVYSNSVEVGYNNFTKNSADYGGAIYERVTGNTINIHDSAFDENHADYGGAIYAGFTKVDSQINRCNFTNNTAIDGGAIYIAGSNQKVINCTFDGNNATRNGGAIYANASLSGVEIKDSTFKNSHAANGGAIYNLGSNSYGVRIENDIFTKNTAVYNGGAVLYINNGKYYRDYNNFDGIGVIEEGRTSVTGGATTFIKTSLFEDNKDYSFIIGVSPDPEVKSLLITLNQPNNFDPTTGKKFRWVVNITNSSGFFREVIITEENYISHYHDSLDGEYLFVTFDEGLTRGATYNIGSWFNTTYFDDESFMTKENFTTGTVQGSAIGQFAILQDQIQRNISQQKDNGKDYYLIELTRLSYRFTNDTDVHDEGCMNITNVDRPLIIIGNGCILDSRGFSRIFNITASNVTFVNITFTGGNASGQPYGDGVDYGGAIFWAGANGVLEHCIVNDNRASVGGGIYYAPSASDCKIINSTFINNFADTNGGAIDCNASRMNLTNTVFDSNHARTGAALCREINATGGLGYGNNFTNNVADYAGAALAWINASSISIDNYYFYNNKAGYSGGALYVGEGSGKCNITNCVFDSNYVDSNGDGEVTSEDIGHGGAIEWYAGEGLVENSTFTNNRAYDGGAIYVGEGANEINITSSNFTQNWAVTTGGAIGVVSSNVTINASNFYYNNATSGAALYMGGDGSTNNVYSSNFIGNKANGGNGGAINWVASSGHIVDTNFTDNCAYNGGAIYFGGDSNYSSVSNCIFTDNHAIFLGGAIDANSSTMNLTNTIFDSNTAQFGAALCREVNAVNGSGINNVFINNHAYVSGAALGWMGSVNITITNYTFINNTADVSGGAIYVGPDSHNCSIISSTFENNYVTNMTSESHEGFSWPTWDNLGAEYIVESTNDPNLVNKTIIDETTRITTYYYWYDDDPSDVLGVGGAIDCLASNATIKDSNFTNNTAKLGGALNMGADSGNTILNNTIFTGNSAYEKGGAVNLHASAVHVDDSKFYNNTAGNGGALYVGGIGTHNRVHESVFEGNNATGYGAGIYWIAQAGEIRGSNFTNNSANYGGAIFFNGRSANTHVTDSIFKLNNATKNGGAIECNASNIGLYNITFTSNYAGEFGGALCREAGATSGHGRNNSFIENHADISGAGIAWMNVKNINIYDYKFINNTAYHSGAAIYLSYGSDNATINYSSFTGNRVLNETGGPGGAIYVAGNNATIINSNFTDNSAYYGGAIWFNDTSGFANVSNSIFTRNTATLDGGAINLRGSGITLTDDKFYENEAGVNGGALYAGLSGKSSVIHDSVFENNKAGHYGGAIDWRASAGEVVNSN
ncbi:MAG: hypothetical protein IJ672_09345, partial [Methanobrevibacter sp.]|nr:hypothetical protein [Methanobrevibacter sp.]